MGAKNGLTSYLVMSGVRKRFKFSPVKSPSLPGFSIDANVCRNPACDNFGVSAEDIEQAKFGYKYTEVNEGIKYQCKRCSQTHSAYSNVSLLEAFHRCLPNSIPYASCPNQACKNHSVNLFEHYHDDPRDKHEKHYRINVNDDKKQYYQARCRNCDKTFPLSKPLRLHTGKRRNWKKDIEMFIKAIVNESGPTKVMNLMEICPAKYYSQLRAASSALLSYNNLHISKFMKASYAPEQLQVFTDSIVCSIKTHRKDERHRKMKIVVSSCIQNNRALILAFHPLFDQQDFDDNALIEDYRLPLEQRRFEYLKHPFNRQEGDPLPMLGVGGFQMEDFYTYLSHCLVLRKLLMQVQSVQLYMDGEASLYNAALTAFSDRIKSGNVDVVVRKMEKAKQGAKSKARMKVDRRLNDARSKSRKADSDSKMPAKGGLRRFLLAEEMKAVNQAIKENSADANRALFPDHLSKVYKTAIRSPNANGIIFWVTNQVPDKDESEVRMLWLTRTAERSNTDFELNLYLNGSIFYIDNVFSYFRQRSALTARPRSTATGHKSYNRNPELPSNLIGDFTINVAFSNFFLSYRNRDKDKVTIAYDHGLVKKPKPPKISSVFERSYTFTNAKRITKWLGT